MEPEGGVVRLAARAEMAYDSIKMDVFMMINWLEIGVEIRGKGKRAPR